MLGAELVKGAVRVGLTELAYKVQGDADEYKPDWVSVAADSLGTVIGTAIGLQAGYEYRVKVQRQELADIGVPEDRLQEFVDRRLRLDAQGGGTAAERQALIKEIYASSPRFSGGELETMEAALNVDEITRKSDEAAQALR